MVTPNSSTRGRVPEKESLPYGGDQRQNGGQHPAPAPVKMNPVTALRNLLYQQQAQIAMALPRALGISPERMARVALTTVQMNPELLKCSAVSVLSCVVQAAQLGLELGGPLGQSYMIPRAGQAVFQCGYRGFINLAHRSNKINVFKGEVVRERDEFGYELGTEQRLKHRPASGDRGAVTHFYAVVTYRTGAVDFEVMTLAEVQEHRRLYSKQGDTKYNPWNTAFEEMGKKTVIIRLAKRCPVSVEVASAVATDLANEEDAILQIPLAGDDGEIIDAEFQVENQSSSAPTEEQMQRQDAALSEPRA